MVNEMPLKRVRRHFNLFAYKTRSRSSRNFVMINYSADVVAIETSQLLGTRRGRRVRAWETIRTLLPFQRGDRGEGTGGVEGERERKRERKKQRERMTKWNWKVKRKEVIKRFRLSRSLPPLNPINDQFFRPRFTIRTPRAPKIKRTIRCLAF